MLGDPGWNQTQAGGGGGGGGSEKMYEGFQVANGGAPIDVWLMPGGNAYNNGTDQASFGTSSVKSDGVFSRGRATSGSFQSKCH